jgi:DNA helicase IV
MSHDYLSDLNNEQRRAVRHGIDSECVTRAPPLLVIAGAGTGKTKTIAHRVAHLVVSPQPDRGDHHRGGAYRRLRATGRYRNAP